jgi:glycosyltransferase involved in cell wall biosynthesis
MTILFNTNFTHNSNAYLTIAVEDAAKNLFGAEHVVLADNRTLLPLAASGRHDTLICFDGQRMNKGLMARLRPAFKTMILWLFEDPFMLEYNKEHVQYFDYVFTNDPSCAPAYYGRGHHLSLGASRKLHYRPVKPDRELDYDVFFAGTMWPNRTALLRSLIAALPEARFKLVCPTNEYLPPIPSDLGDLAIHRPISHEAFIDFANASRVTITMFRDYASHGDVSLATAPGPRLYELGLSGTAQIVESGSEIDPFYFQSTGGVILTQGADALVHETRKILRDPDLRAEHALTAQRAIETHHLYENRLEQIARVTGANFLARSAPAPSAAAVQVKRRLRILMCTHSTIHENVWGGVEVYQRTLGSMFEHEADIFYWVRRNGSCRLIDANGVTVERFDAPDIGWLDILCDQFEESIFSNIIGHYGIDVVHFQHLGHHPASLPIIAKAAGAGVVFSMHDFYLVCHRYNLLNFEQSYCDIRHKSISACDVCLKVAENLPAGVQQTRRSFINEMLKSVDVVLFGSVDSQKTLTEIYPQATRIRGEVAGIPSPNPVAAEPIIRPAPTPDAPLVVAIVGNFLRSKGADTVISIIEAANPALFRFHIIGNAEQQYVDVFSRWQQPNVVYHGRFSPGDMPEIAAEADVALHLSIWPETYCISLSEIWQYGLIPIVTDVGALGDRVIDGVNGFKVAINAASAVLDKLELLRASPQLRARIRDNITPDLWTDYTRYARNLMSVYRSVAPQTSFSESSLNFDIGQMHLLPHASWKDLAPPRHIFDPPRTNSVRIELPAGLQTWTAIQGAEAYVDSVCGIAVDKLATAKFKPTADIRIRGWTFNPAVSVAGQIYLTLIGEGTASTIFPGAPRRSGYLAQFQLRGKWTNGSYRVATVSVVGDKAGFQLTPVMIEMLDGMIVGAKLTTLDNDLIIEMCNKVGEKKAPPPRRGQKCLGLTNGPPEGTPDGALDGTLDGGPDVAETLEGDGDAEMVIEDITEADSDGDTTELVIGQLKLRKANQKGRRPR